MHSIVMIHHENGFEALTFKNHKDIELRKLVSIDISENKHLLLTYIISLYWVDRIPDYLSNKNIKDPKLKLKKVKKILASAVEDDETITM
jgi:hypothetical protein